MDIGTALTSCGDNLDQSQQLTFFQPPKESTAQLVGDEMLSTLIKR